MRSVINFLKALFNFFVGDWIILIGIAITLIVVALVENLAALESLKGMGGYLFFTGVVFSLAATLRHEIAK